MVEAIQVYRVKNPDGSTSDFASQAEAIKHEVRIELLTAIAGMPENATPAHDEIVGALLAEAGKFSRLLGLVAADNAVAADIGRPAVQQGSTESVVKPVPPRPPAPPRPGAARGPGANRGPGLPSRSVPLHEMNTSATSFGDGPDGADE